MGLETNAAALLLKMRHLDPATYRRIFSLSHRAFFQPADLGF